MFIQITLGKFSIHRVVVATLAVRTNQTCFTQMINKYALSSLKTRAVPTSQMRNSDRLKIAHLFNQYPKVSHRFFSREIQALERWGLEVAWFLVWPPGDLVDAADKEEAACTRILLTWG